MICLGLARLQEGPNKHVQQRGIAAGWYQNHTGQLGVTACTRNTVIQGRQGTGQTPKVDSWEPPGRNEHVVGACKKDGVKYAQFWKSAVNIAMPGLETAATCCFCLLPCYRDIIQPLKQCPDSGAPCSGRSDGAEHKSRAPNFEPDRAGTAAAR